MFELKIRPDHSYHAHFRWTSSKLADWLTYYRLTMASTELDTSSKVLQWAPTSTPLHLHASRNNLPLLKVSTRARFSEFSQNNFWQIFCWQVNRRGEREREKKKTKRRKIGSANRNCKERMNYLLRVSSRSDCSSALHSKANPESCFKLVFSPPFTAGLPFPFETAPLVAPLEGGAAEATSIVAGDEYLGVAVVPLPAAFWLLLCKWALTAELWLALACTGTFGPDPAIADCAINTHYSVCFCDSLREHTRKER